MTEPQKTEIEQAAPRIYVGVKWGLLLPTVMLAARYYPPPRDHIHLIRELYVKGMLLENLIAVGKTWKDELQVRKFFCDPTQLKFIAQMRKSRLWAVPVENELSLAISMVEGRLGNFQRKLPGGLAASPDCPMIVREFPKYHTPERKGNKPMKDKPLEVDNYALSALHFLVVGLSTERTPRVRWI